VVPDAPFTVMNGTDNYLAKGGTTGSAAASLLEAMWAPRQPRIEPDPVDHHDAGMARAERRRCGEASGGDRDRRRHHRRRSQAAPRKRRPGSAPARDLL
jgi:hypothetical protein